MKSPRQWRDYIIWSTFIVGHQYVTVLANFKCFEEVVETVLNYIEELNEPNGRKIPFVLLNAHDISDAHSEQLKELELVTIVME